MFTKWPRVLNENEWELQWMRRSHYNMKNMQQDICKLDIHARRLGHHFIRSKPAGTTFKHLMSFSCVSERDDTQFHCFSTTIKTQYKLNIHGEISSGYAGTFQKAMEAEKQSQSRRRCSLKLLLRDWQNPKGKTQPGQWLLLCNRSVEVHRRPLLAACTEAQLHRQL